MEADILKSGSLKNGRLRVRGEADDVPGRSHFLFAVRAFRDLTRLVFDGERPKLGNLNRLTVFQPAT